MKARSCFSAVSVAALLLTLHSSQMQVDASQAALLAPLPPGLDVEISADEAKKPLLLAGNTACNPRVTVCEE